MLYRLVILSGPHSGQQITVDKTSTTIGSGPGCAIRIADDEMANQHVRLESSQKGLFIRDLGTMHKILVNHHQAEEYWLKHGDEFEIGRTRFLVQATVRAEIDSTSAAAAREARDKAQRRRDILYRMSVIAGTAAVFYYAWPHIRNFTVKNYDDSSSNAVPSVADGDLKAPVKVSTNFTPSAVKPETIRPTPVSPTNQVVAIPTVKVPAPTTTNATHNPTQGPPAGVRTMPSPTDSIPTTPFIKIDSVDPNKFHGTDTFDEMRTLTVTLRRDTPAKIDIDALAVEVRFFDTVFDKDLVEGKVEPSRMQVPDKPLKADGPWASGEKKSVTATYVVPKVPKTDGTRRPAYYGYTIRVLYAGKVQDQASRPADLLKNHRQSRTN